MAFNIGLSGLRAATSDLNVTGNNIANAGTAGFKQSRAEFADVYAASVLGSGSNAQGSGVLLANVSQLYNQGNINYTQNALDLAINGNGFFVTSNNGDVGYTRAGYFGTDRDGFVVNNFGYRLQGNAVDANGNVQSGVVGDLKIETASQAPKASSKLDQNFNLNSTLVSPKTWQASYDAEYNRWLNDPVNGVVDPANPTGAQQAAAATSAASVADATFNPSDPTTYNSSTSVNIYDTQGNAHVLTQYFVKTGANDWDMKMLVDGRNPADPGSTTPYALGLSFNSTGQLQSVSDENATPGLVTIGADMTVTINAASGNPPTPGSGWIPAISDNGKPPVWNWNGAQANAGGIAFDFSDATQFSSAFAVNSVSQDGYTTGQLSGLEIDDTGVIFARYTNGQSKVQGQIVLANFANVQGLTPVGKTGWVQSFESGEPVVGTPRTGTMGALQAGALEDSNVELSDQLVNLIVAQRNYQANAKTIETESAITQTIINLR
ncbi:flagellar hook protein FlgE [Pseudomonas cavernicola]|uniref:Flagellar hook protein FlgE n=1 Tax=Pseudomonas cavernicola TaxID=2320866 RepID=A0A418XC17_9PSED|nr:flagellar hook protein FlgE [Pseudomonas cavernicola]RJG09873.1 flagellar hook protein FlgE [Pseudomonas cavernicola]